MKLVRIVRHGRRRGGRDRTTLAHIKYSSYLETVSGLGYGAAIQLRSEIVGRTSYDLVIEDPEDAETLAEQLKVHAEALRNGKSARSSRPLRISSVQTIAARKMGNLPPHR